MPKDRADESRVRMVRPISMIRDRRLETSQFQDYNDVVQPHSLNLWVSVLLVNSEPLCV